MRIGDSVFVHGYVDEIRKDCVIIRNRGGYFGTEKCEVIQGDGIVRCKDCRYFKKIAERSDSGLCHRDIVASAWKENGYCSRGERKGGDDE